MEIGSAKVVEESGIERMIGGGKEVTRVRPTGLIHRRMTMKSTDESIERNTNQKRIENQKARGIARRGGGSITGVVIVRVAVEAAAGVVVEPTMILLVAQVARRKRDQ